jgi:hypothetical protein
MRKPGAESAATIFFPFIFRNSAVTKGTRSAVFPAHAVHKQYKAVPGRRAARHHEIKQALCQIKEG